MTTDQEPQVELPEAELSEARHRSWAWLVPLLAMIGAVAFLARAWDQRGTPITIHFQDGHGIEAGDSMRYRGIEVGRVHEVRLARGMGGVDVRVQLEESSADLARTGAGFWVVRPRIAAGAVSGLDTLVGARYLTVDPPPVEAPRATHFVGLEEEPLRSPEGSLELTLEADAGGGVARGAPVTYRRQPVGRVLEVGLSGDARLVEVSISIDPAYAGLVLENTRFFETSGLDLDFGLSGLELSVESLEALIAGGVGLATPEENAPPATSGQRFPLYASADPEWLQWRPALAVGQDNGARPHPVRAELFYESGLLRRDHELEAWALWLEGGLLGPTDLVTLPEDAREGSASLEVSGATLIPTTAAGESPIQVVPLVPPKDAPPPWPLTRTTTPTEPVPCIAVADPELAPLALDAPHLSPTDAGWAIADSLPIDDFWHGAAVVTRESGHLVGVLLIGEDEARVAFLR